MAIIKRISSKATPQKLVSYLTNEEKTEEKLISGKDCNPDNIVNEFKATQELYGKCNGVQYHHLVQSFSPEDNITPEKAHALGKELAASQFKEHEVFIVTHRDKRHIHNHLVVNSVSFESGLKYNASNKSLWDIKRESNRLCERENLKTLDLNHKSEQRITSAEKRIMDRGGTPWKDELRQCIDIAKSRNVDLHSFRDFLNKEFDIETRITKKSISYKHPDHGKAIRGRSLGSDYDKEELENGFVRQEKSISREGERGITSERNSRAEGTANVDWSAVGDNLKGKRNRISKQPSNDVTGEIQRKVRNVKERTNRSIGKGKSEDREIREQQQDVQRSIKPRDGEAKQGPKSTINRVKSKSYSRGWEFDR